MQCDVPATFAAIRLDNGEIYTMAPPNRHHNIIRKIRDEGIKEFLEGDKQGFVDNKGRFLRRKQALTIAQNAGQVIKQSAGTWAHGLFSEDVW